MLKRGRRAATRHPACAHPTKIYIYICTGTVLSSSTAGGSGNLINAFAVIGVTVILDSSACIDVEVVFVRC